MKFPVYELKAELRVDAVPAAEELLAEREEQSLMVLEDRPSGRAWLAGYFASREEAEQRWLEIAAVFDRAWLLAGHQIALLPDKDWKESYKEHFKAWRFGRLHWVPVWERESFRLPPGDEVLWLDPGMAFGTGNHETTRLVIERVVELTPELGKDDGVIDAGCGSGILALSAAKLGFRKIAAFDNDPLAIGVSRENAALNGMAGRVDFYVGDLVTGLDGRRARLVLANIQADVLMKFAAGLLASVAEGGVLILSGILASEIDRVRDAFRALAPECRIDSRTLGEWCDLVLKRP